MSIAMTQSISAAIADGLDDYTIDQRGDIGSLVRVEAIDAVHAAWQQGQLPELVLQDLGSRVCRLALEKLDKVRLRAWHCLYGIWDDLVGGPNLSKYIYNRHVESVSNILQWPRRRSRNIILRLLLACSEIISRQVTPFITFAGVDILCWYWLGICTSSI